MNNVDEWMEATAQGSSITVEDLDALCVAYKAAQEEYEKAKEVSTNLYNEAEKLKGKVVEAMEQSGKSKYYVEGLGTFSFRDKMSVTIPKTIEDKKIFFEYLYEKFGETVYWDKVGIHSGTLNSFYNAELELFNEKALKGEATGDFSLPGLAAPTAMRSLAFNKEKKK